MIGIDITKITRIERLYNKFGKTFLDKFLNENEQKLATKIDTIAGFWATKEAFSKALGVGISKEFSFFDIEIKKTKKNAPKIKISKKIKKRFKIKKAYLSISHDGDIAIAVVVIKG